MKKKLTSIFIIMLLFILSVVCLTSCNKTKTDTNINTKASVINNEEKELPPKKVSFHNTSFTIPGKYELDSSASDDNTSYYKVFDDNGDLQEMVYAIFQEGNRDDNILDEEIANAYCEAVTSDENIHDYTGYKVIKIDDKLSALYFTFQMDSNGKTYNNAAVVFNTDEGHIYSIYAASVNDDNEELLQQIIDSLNYDFEIWQKRFTLQMQIDFEHNLFLDIYDVEVYLDDTKLGTVKQGKKFNYETKVKEGKYNITFYKSGNHAVSGSTEIHVGEDKAFYCTIKSHSEDIEIKNQEEEIIESDDAIENGAVAHNLILTVDYESNYFLNKYDVDIYLNSKKIGTVSQGNTFKETVNYKAGKHNLVFRSSDDRSVKGTIPINIDCDRFYSCAIKAHTLEIEISNQKTETVEEYNRKKELKEAQKRAEEARKAAEEAQRVAKEKEEAAQKEANAQFETLIKDCVRRKISRGEQIAEQHGYEVRLFNLDKNNITKKYYKKDDNERNKYRIYKVGNINHEQKYVNLIAGTVNKLTKKEKKRINGMKKESLDYAYDQAEEDGYTMVVKNRNGKRVDNKEKFKTSNYVLMSVEKVNYDKAKIVVKADTKKHIEKLEEIARKKAIAKAKAKAAKLKRDAKAYAEKARDGLSVCLTRTGKYHLDGCRDLDRAKSYRFIDYGIAKRKYSACLHCNPDVYCERCYDSFKEEYIKNHK